jgi:TonB family protein
MENGEWRMGAGRAAHWRGERDALSVIRPPLSVLRHPSVRRPLAASLGRLRSFAIATSMGVASACGGPAWAPPETTVVPRYPPVLISAGIQGQVHARFEVRSDGSVDPASIVIDSATNSAWREPVTNAIRQWRFGDTGRSPQRTVLVTYRVTDCTPHRIAPVGTWHATGGEQRLDVLACRNRLVSRERVDSMRRAAGMPPLPPARP